MKAYAVVYQALTPIMTISNTRYLTLSKDKAEKYIEKRIMALNKAAAKNRDSIQANFYKYVRDTGKNIWKRIDPDSGKETGEYFRIKTMKVTE